jgi:hypothetical protein
LHDARRRKVANFGLTAVALAVTATAFIFFR